MKEEEWIEALIRRLAATGVGDEIDGTPAASTALGPGDDAALIPLPAGEIPVLSADTMVEGVHFRDRWLSDRELGARILRVSLSDLAAMAARPRATRLAIETPELPGRLGEEFLDGIEETLSIVRLSLAGGNLTRTPGPLAITCTVIGGVLPGEEVRRQGARAGDTLWVTGRPGEAGAGRRLLGEMEMAARDQAPLAMRLVTVLAHGVLMLQSYDLGRLVWAGEGRHAHDAGSARRAGLWAA
ncbi:MAG: thiamine-monophosphate kinase, partial [Planctomycetota bacterium]